MKPERKCRVLLLGPSLQAVSGVSTHLGLLFGSFLSTGFELLHFQVGSEGRAESRLQKLWRFAASPFHFSAALLRHKPDVVHLNTSLEPKSYWRDLIYLLLAKLVGRKVVYQVHGGALPQDFFPRSRLLTGLLRGALRLPDAVVLLADIELRAYRQFVPEARLVVIANAIETADLVDAPLALMAEAPLHLAYLGRLAENKGIFDIVAALCLLRNRNIRVRVSIAGGGPDEARLRQAVESAGMQDMVHFWGPLFGPEKNALWKAADVFVFPTYHREGLPYALLEAMAAGAVPVTCPVGAIPDVMADGVHGLFVNPQAPEALAAALERLDRDRPLLFRLAAASRLRVQEHYTVERLADDFDQLYRSLQGPSCAASPAI